MIATISINHNNDSESFPFYLSIFVFHDKLQGGCDFPGGKSYLKIFTFMIFSLFLNIEETLEKCKNMNLIVYFMVITFKRTILNHVKYAYLFSIN